MYKTSNIINDINTLVNLKEKKEKLRVKLNEQIQQFELTEQTVNLFLKVLNFLKKKFQKEKILQQNLEKEKNRMEKIIDNDDFYRYTNSAQIQINYPQLQNELNIYQTLYEQNQQKIQQNINDSNRKNSIVYVSNDNGKIKICESIYNLDSAINKNNQQQKMQQKEYLLQQNQRLMCQIEELKFFYNEIKQFKRQKILKQNQYLFQNFKQIY